jgi:hypothetical protein
MITPIESIGRPARAGEADTTAGVPEDFIDYTLDAGRTTSVKFEQPAPHPTLVLTPVS